MRRSFFIVLLILAEIALASGVAFAASRFCAPLPDKSGDVKITVTNAEAANLASIVYDAKPHTTILLEDGTYSTGALNFQTPHVTLRAKSGNRDGVILDGRYHTQEIISVSASNVTIADLTIRRAYDHAIHIVGGGHSARLYDLHIVDAREQFIKVNPSGTDYADYGTLACSLLEMTDAGRAYLQENPLPEYLCYTGGLDAHQAWGWTVRDNTIKNIYCTNGSIAEHGIHFWNSCREPTVERNWLINNARGIGFGLGGRGGQRIYPDNPLSGSGLSPRDVQHIGGVIRNNVVFANTPYFDTGIGLEQAWNVSVYHNTVYSAKGGLGIDIRFAHSNPSVKNNLASPFIHLRDGGKPRQSAGNIQATPEMFVDTATGDLHLLRGALQAINKGVQGVPVPTDIDGDPRDGQPDIGADEYQGGLTDEHGPARGHREHL